MNTAPIRATARPASSATVVGEWQRQQGPHVLERLRAHLQHMPELLASVHAAGPGHFGVANRTVLALVNQDTAPLEIDRFPTNLSPRGGPTAA